MASNVPTIKQINWIAVILQILLIGIIIYVYRLLNIGDPFIFGALTYLILSFGLKNLLSTDHRQGIKLVKQQKYADAIHYFKKSVDYFSKNAWVDKYRFLTLLSFSNITFSFARGLFSIIAFKTTNQIRGSIPIFRYFDYFIC